MHFKDAGRGLTSHAPDLVLHSLCYSITFVSRVSMITEFGSANDEPSYLLPVRARCLRIRKWGSKLTVDSLYESVLLPNLAPISDSPQQLFLSSSRVVFLLQLATSLRS